MANTDKEQGYLSMLAAAAPVFALKSVVGDMPKAAVEHAVEQTSLHGSGNFGKYLARGFRGKGAGRALGAGLGILTAPLFLRGTRLLESRKDEDRRKGYALVAGSTAALAGAKGFFENAAGALAQGKNPAVAASKGAILGTIRAGYKVPMALATAAGVAAGRAKAEDDPRMKYVLPVAMGIGAGAISRSIEEAAETGISRNRKQLLSAKGLRKLRAAGLGGAAGGAIGGLVLAKAVDMLAPKKEKQAGVALDTSMAIGKLLLEGAPIALAQHATTGAGYGYKSQSRVLGKLIGNKLLRKHQMATNTHRARQIGLGIKEGLYGESVAPLTSKLLSDIGPGIGGLSPESNAYRELGISLGRSLRDKPAQERERYLQRIQKFLLDRPDTLKGQEGELNPLTGPLAAGISMAIGERPMYHTSKHFPTFKRWGIKAMHGTSGAHANEGLPTELGTLQREAGWLKSNYPHILAAGAGVGAALTGAPWFVAAPLGHAAFSGGKNMVTTIPIVKKEVTKSLHRGIRYGAFPNAPFRPSLGLEYGLSPATTMMERSLKPIVRAVRDEEVAKLVGKTRGYIADAKDKIIAKKVDTTIPKALLAPAGAGAAAGLVGMSLLQNSKNKKRK